MSKYIKLKFYEDDDMLITLEEMDGELMVHLAMYKCSRPIIRKALELWSEILRRAYWQGYEHIYTYTMEPRMFKFFVNGKKFGEFEKDGKTYEVWGWELN